MQNYNDKLQESYVLATNFIKEENVIGIQKEKILHKTLKYYLCSDDSKHEIKIKKSNSGILYADVYDNEMIYEIQTRGFDKLRDKLSEFLIEHKVTIVHAVAHKKNIYKVYETGEIIGPTKSPKTGKVFEVFKELYKIKTYLNNPNLNLKIFLICLSDKSDLLSIKSYGSSTSISSSSILFSRNICFIVLLGIVS